jgi:quinol monooxygenase YgiN
VGSRKPKEGGIVVIVVANVTAKTGCEDELRALLDRLVDPTRAEEGCLQYDLHQSDASPTDFMFYERWASPSHLEAHLKTPHFLDVRARSEPLRAADPVIATYHLVR